MTLVLLLVVLHVSFLAVMCQATYNGVNFSDEIGDTFNVELIVGFDDGQILKLMNTPNLSIVRIAAFRISMNHKTGGSGDCRLPTVQVCTRRLFPMIASALVITLLPAAISASASTRWVGRINQEDGSIGGNYIKEDIPTDGTTTRCRLHRRQI